MEDNRIYRIRGLVNLVAGLRWALPKGTKGAKGDSGEGMLLGPGEDGRPAVRMPRLGECCGKLECMLDPTDSGEALIGIRKSGGDIGNGTLRGESVEDGSTKGCDVRDGRRSREG